MSKTFFDMMDGVLEEYYQARSKTIVGVDMKHYHESIRRELSMNVQQWFFKYVDAIAGNVTEIKKGLDLHANEAPDGGMRPPTSKTGLNL